MGLFFSLLAALFWGTGDFCGGLAARKRDQYLVLAVSAFSGALVLALAALIGREPFPHGWGLLWSILAGLGGAAGIASLYRGLSIGNSAVVAPTSAVIGAALPVGVTLLLHGAPQTIQLIGFGVALVGIVLVSTSIAHGDSSDRRGFALGVIAGIGFALYFIFIAQAGEGLVFTPLVLARTCMLLAALALVGVRRLPLPRLQTMPVALLAGVFDATGNVFFLLAKTSSRLDFAVILSSIYPAITVLWTALFLKEKLNWLQKLGLVVCLVAILLITAQ
ncbi:MAG: DMT family transporter [Anaerolineaceae bacterium]|nr:DMT family transporter [Anaerolineaceae bacterium]